jgi:hypothetical protein
MWRIVIDGDDDGAFRAFEHGARIGAARIPQVCHLPGVAAREPFAEVIELGEHLADTAAGGQANDAAQIEAEGAGALGDPNGLLAGFPAGSHGCYDVATRFACHLIAGCIQSRAVWVHTEKR